MLIVSDQMSSTGNLQLLKIKTTQTKRKLSELCPNIHRPRIVKGRWTDL